MSRTWPTEIPILPVSGPLSGCIRPPGSKSITNRALIIAALAEGESRLTGALESEDTRVMLDSLARLGFTAHADFKNLDPSLREVRITGQGGVIPAQHADLYIANSGTSVRFLTALVALGNGRYRLDGTPRMRERPIQDLLDSLWTLKVLVSSEAGNGCPPVMVAAAGLFGGAVTVRGDVSSQFLSALLMVAPYAIDPIELQVAGELVSKPYIDITLQVMHDFGVTVERDGYQRFAVPQVRYQPRQYAIEPDASAASYWFAAAAITGGSITVAGLSRDALQGDVRFVNVLEQMGCRVVYDADGITVTGGALRGIDVDMNAVSDTVQTLSAVALFAEGPTRVRGVAHNRHKETDRIGNLAIELRKFGATVDEHGDGLTITPGPLSPARVATYHDHRMAMSLALVGLRVPGTVILDPACVEKTYPEFFDDLTRVCGGEV